MNAHSSPLASQLHRERMARQARRAALAVLPPPNYAEQAERDLADLREAENKRRWDEAVAEAAKQAARAFLESLMGEPPYPSVRSIVGVVANAYSITPLDLISHRRLKRVSTPRHVAIYLCRVTTPLSFPEIARVVGKRDHSTVINSVKVVGSMMKADPAFRAKVEGLREAVLAERGGA